MSNTTTTIAIIGGGCSGTTIAAQQMLELIKEKTIMNWAASSDHKVNFRIYDKDGSIGRGEPYAQDKDDIFLLNQPVYAMSPMPDYPDHFGSWLSNNKHPYTQDDFAPRGLYGQYLQEVFAKACTAYKTLECGNVDIVASTIMNVSPSASNSYSVITSEYEAHNADIVVLASGHCRSELLSEYNNHERYFSAPYDKERAVAVLKDATDPALIIGTSQSMLDGLALLDYIGFKQPIYAISRRLVKPWKFDARAHRERIGSYEYQFLTRQALSQAGELSFGELKILFEDDLQEGQHLGFPKGHIISCFQPPELAEAINNPVTLSSFKKLIEHVRALYGNPTSPERFKLMEEYEKRGQLQFLQADILEADISNDNEGFTVALKGQEPMKLSALFNSSSYSMKAISDNKCVASPLLRVLDDNGALKRHETDQNAFAFGEQNWNNVFLAGPSCNSQRWGVETFRESLVDIAKHSVQRITRNIQAAPT